MIEPTNIITESHRKKSPRRLRYLSNKDIIIRTKEEAIKLSLVLYDEVRNRLPKNTINQMAIPNKPLVKVSAVTNISVRAVIFVGRGNTPIFILVSSSRMRPI